jgi:glucose-6-phosphate isomerase
MTAQAASTSSSGVAGLMVEVCGEELRHAQLMAENVLEGADIPARLVRKDAALWGPEAHDEAARRLGWLDLPTTSKELLPRLASLWADLQAEGLDHVVLVGMGGSSLAPEVIAAVEGVPLTVLDSTDPGQVRRVLQDRLERAIVVVSSKSGGTIETDSHRRAFEAAFTEAGIDPARRLVVVTDPGSPLERIAKEGGYRDVFLADAEVGGRYSALSAFGLVPVALAGVDVSHLLDAAASLSSVLGGTAGNPALALGAVLGEGAAIGKDKLVLVERDRGVRGFADWAEQLVAESTGKNGKGLLPVVVGHVDPAALHESPDNHLVVLGRRSSADNSTGTFVDGPLGAMFLGWEYAVAVAGRLIGINPFDQPNVQESKDNTSRLLEQAGDGPLPEGEPLFTEGPVEVHVQPGLEIGSAHDLPSVLRGVLHGINDHGYLAIMAYLDRESDGDAAQLRAALASATDRPVTFGWGPRFLHSTGQYHKGGPATGSFLQLTGAVTEDVEIPGRPFTFGRLQMAQALGDVDALRQRGRPVVRLHLRDRAEGLRLLLGAAESIRSESMT